LRGSNNSRRWSAHEQQLSGTAEKPGKEAMRLCSEQGVGPSRGNVKDGRNQLTPSIQLWNIDWAPEELDDEYAYSLAEIMVPDE
jgi:hypothetical protein